VPNVLSRGVFNLFFGSRRKALGNLPGPVPGILGTAGDFLGPPPWQVCARYGREYGGVTLIWLGGSPGLVLNDPALIEEVLDSRRTEFEKGSVNEQIRPSVTNHSVFIAKQSEDWEAKRRSDPFEQPWAEDWLAAQVAPMQAVIAKSVAALVGDASTAASTATSTATSVDIVPPLRRMTTDAFAVAAIGHELPDAVFDDFMLLAKAATDRIQAKLPLRFVSPPKGFEAARTRYYAYFAEQLTAARKAKNPAAVDLLSRTLREMPGIDDEVLSHVIALIFFGGVFSASTTLVGAFHQLQKYPGTQERLVTEATPLVKDGLSLERVRGARWTEAVTYEALRILPAVRLFTRTPVADTKLAGITLPAGAMILISNQHLHRDPAHWPSPDTFDPARWLDGGIARDPLGSGYFFPYGRGPRACVGLAFAMAFLQTALATIAARVQIQLDSTEPFEEGFFFGGVLPKGVTGKFIAR
jgi:cytochrome P450